MNHPKEHQLKIGDKFNRLTLLKLNVKVEKSSTKNVNQWLSEFQCECGKICLFRKARVVIGHNTSCGCRGINHTTHEARAFEVVLRNYKYGAKGRNLEWNLTDEDAMKFFKMNCFYCNALPKESIINQGGSFKRYDKWVHKYSHKIKYNGIDRLNNKLGYTLLNCVPACSQCNIGKQTQTLSQYLDNIKRIYENLQLNQIESLCNVV